MVPATFVRLEWPGLHDLDGAVTYFQAEAHDVARILEPELVAVNRRGHPGWCCTAIIPRGQVTITVTDPDGAIVWTKKLTTAQHRMLVTIPAGP